MPDAKPTPEVTQRQVERVRSMIASKMEASKVKGGRLFDRVDLQLNAGALAALLSAYEAKCAECERLSDDLITANGIIGEMA